MSLPHRLIAALVAATLLQSVSTHRAGAQAPASPRVELTATSILSLTGGVDSNSPALWQLVDGRPQFHVMTSVDGKPALASGDNVRTLSDAAPVSIDPHPGGGVWMEAIVADEGGTWYGYYHHERIASDVCPGTDKVLPRIGAARSLDRGKTWEDLGIVLEAPRGTHQCRTTNRYFVGGVGDFSVMLDHDSRDLYFFFSQYLASERWQGLGIARLLWADRDEPVGRMAVRVGRVWLPGRARGAPDGNGKREWSYPAATPLFPVGDSWHDDDTIVDAFWGPSVHWNTYLQQYVMLLNRARNAEWQQEGTYVSFAPRLDDRRLWTTPVKVLDGGRWYPQVVGTEPASGSDKTAGEYARFFMSGTSRYVIRFIR